MKQSSLRSALLIIALVATPQIKTMDCWSDYVPSAQAVLSLSLGLCMNRLFTAWCTLSQKNETIERQQNELREARTLINQLQQDLQERGQAETSEPIRKAEKYIFYSDENAEFLPVNAPM